MVLLEDSYHSGFEAALTGPGDHSGTIREIIQEFLVAKVLHNAASGVNTIRVGRAVEEGFS